MPPKKRGLGRGLDALLSSAGPVESTPKGVAADGTAADTFPEIDVNLLSPGRYQPRRDMEPQALEELSASIKAQGVMQPIVIRPIDSDQYEIIAGERRWRAAQMAGLTKVPAVIKHVTDEAAIAMSLIENIQRENLNPIEEAIALSRLQEEFSLTQQEVADAVGKSRSAVTNLLRLMNLQVEVRKMLEYGDIEMGHARALLPLEAEQQVATAREVVAKAYSVRQTEAFVRKQLEAAKHPENSAKKSAPKDPVLGEWEEAISQRLSAPVSISRNRQGKGKITIAYDSAEALESILSNLK
ncbi:MAG: ParB/RepB/Spo0J family partition protein [Pontibacterium sp.]